MRNILVVACASILLSACDDAPSGTGGSSSSSGKSGSGSSTTGSTSASSSATDASSSGTGGPVGCASYAFCEDFEDGAPGQMPPEWTEKAGWDQGGSRAVLSTEEKHGGAQSLKGAVGTNGQFRIERPLSGFGDLATHHWGRIFYKVKTPITLTGGYLHNTFVALGRPDGGNRSETRVVDTVVAPDGTHQFLLNVPDDSCCPGSSYDFQYDAAWHCAEWYVDGASQAFRFFYDGTEVTDIAETSEPGAHLDDLDSIIVGWINYQSPSMPNEGWFDDLALDDERIGCN